MFAKETSLQVLISCTSEALVLFLANLSLVLVLVLVVLYSLNTCKLYPCPSLNVQLLLTGPINGVNWQICFCILSDLADPQLQARYALVWDNTQKLVQTREPQSSVKERHGWMPTRSRTGSTVTHRHHERRWKLLTFRSRRFCTVESLHWWYGWWCVASCESSWSGMAGYVQ